AKTTNGQSRTNLRMIAVLKGSTSANFSAVPSSYSEMPNRIRKMMYFRPARRVFRPWGTLIWGTCSFCATWLVSSCKAPKGHSQPQNAPRFQKISDIAVAIHRMNTIGSIRKYSQLKAVRSDVVKVSTFTTESCAWAYQPIQNSVKSRNTVRNRL